MTIYLLDTSVIIDYLRGKKETVELVNSLNGQMTSSTICLAELYEGVYRVKEQKQVRNAILQFFASLSRTYTITQQTAEMFGKLRAQLKRKGQVIEDLDIFIAATCLANDAVLVTHNQKHFAVVPNLKIYA